jgi:alkaline phosphatase D
MTRTTGRAARAASLALPVAVLATLVPLPAARGQARYLQSGPMLGYGEPREVLLWVQTNAAARVKFAYWDEDAPEVRFETEETLTAAADAHVAKLVADRVVPGRRYAYELLINGERVERPYPTRFRARLPRAAFGGGPVGLGDFRLALGSCFWVNDPGDSSGFRPGADYGIFTAIAAKQPDLMLWLGDNVYLRDADASSRSGLLGRYSQTRSLPELQPLLASTHHYAIWDDHDYGPNDSDRSYREKHHSREAFMLFWGNPGFGVEGSPGITTRFAWGDVEFFLLDNRWNRSPNRRATGRRQALGEAQLEWLTDALASSGATFKVVAVGSQVLNPHPIAETFATVPDERQALLDRIAAEGVRGVLFVTGDRHFTELSRLDVPGRYPLYDLTVSPLTTWVETNGAREPNALRVPGTHVAQRNFATIDVAGPREDRRLTLAVWDVRGAPLWSRTIGARELRPQGE